MLFFLKNVSYHDDEKLKVKVRADWDNEFPIFPTIVLLLSKHVT